MMSDVEKVGLLLPLWAPTETDSVDSGQTKQAALNELHNN